MNRLYALLFLLGISYGLGAQTNNSLWTHVGPKSNNLENGNDFETGRLEMIAVNPNDEQKIFAGGLKTGLWYSSDGAENWAHVPTYLIGTSAVSAIEFNGSDELIVANHVDYPYASIDETTGMFKYNADLDQWYSLASIPITTRTYIVNSIAVDPNNDSHILAGTSHGLYRSLNGGNSWTAVSSALEYIQDVQFVFDAFNSQYDVYYTGTNISLSDSDEDIHALKGEPIMERSTDNGVSFTEITSLGNAITTAFPNQDEHGTVFCHGTSTNFNETVLYTYTARDPQIQMGSTTEDSGWNIVCKIVVNNQTNTHSTSIINDYGGGSDYGTVSRMSIAHDDLNERLWVGATVIRYVDLTNNNLVGFGYPTSNLNTPTKVHADLHDLFISSSNPNFLYAVSDGGFYKNDLSTPDEFEYKNNGLHIAMIPGFSGSEMDPNYYVVGLHDIIHTSLYDEELQGNRYTHFTWENDGGLIDAFNEDIVILDKSEYDNRYKVSTDGGATVGGLETPFSGTSFGLNPYFQDPFRERLYVGMKSTSISEFNFVTNKFDIVKSRIHMAAYMNMPASETWHMQVRRMAFSRDNPNSIHLITTENRPPPDHPLGDPFYRSPGEVIQYIGNDFDAMIKNPSSLTNEHYDSDGNPQWRKVSPDWEGGTNLGSGLNTVPHLELPDFEYTGVVKSQSNEDHVFVSITKVPNNPGVKVLRFNNTTWEDYSTGIPSDQVPSAMIGDPMSNDGMYVITERNVYYRDATMSSWMQYGTDMPQIFAYQLEINQLERTLRAGTYGMGIWKTKLKCPENAVHFETGVYAPDYTLVEGSFIYSTAEVNPSKEANYKANTRIQLNPGFKAKAGCKFRAVIASCTPSSSYNKAAIIADAEAIDFDEFLRSELDIDGIQVQPNPSNGRFSIRLEGLDEQASIRITNMQGRTIDPKIGFVREGEMNVDLSGNSAGVYVLIVQKGAKVYREKIVVQ